VCLGRGKGGDWAEMMSDERENGEAGGPFAGKGSKDGKVVLVLEGDVGIEEGEQLREKGGERERVGWIGGSQVPLGRVQVEDNGKMGTVHR
jgi:hypothetical protein